MPGTAGFLSTFLLEIFLIIVSIIVIIELIKKHSNHRGGNRAPDSQTHVTRNGGSGAPVGLSFLARLDLEESGRWWMRCFPRTPSIAGSGVQPTSATPLLLLPMYDTTQQPVSRFDSWLAVRSEEGRWIECRFDGGLLRFWDRRSHCVVWTFL